jgi:flagellar capping protein FliD
MWAEAIQSAKPEWCVGWSPQPRKDKRLWVRIAEMGEVTKESKDKLQAVEKECIARGYTVHSIFAMTNSVGVIFAQTAHASALINDGITIPSISPHPLPTYPFRQIEPIWAFELVISGISRYDFGLVQSLDQYMTHTFRDDSGSLFHASRTIDDYYCFVMRDWQATKLVLLKADDIEGDFARQSLSKPKLVYELNSGGGMIERRGTSDAVKIASQKIGSEVDALRRDLEDMRRETKQNFAMASQQFQTISNSMGVLTTSVSTLASQLQCNTHAMLG